MFNSKIIPYLQVIVLFTIVLIFLFLRIKPIYYESVGYTYDQGRDFLKAAEIVLYKNPTFIGPTTGINGIYHGAWWYYLLSFSFLVFGGNPITFYYFNLLIQFIAFMFFLTFCYKYFGFLTSAILSFFVATSGHFIFTSIFLGNNVMAMPAFLLLLTATILLIEKKKITIKGISYTAPLFFITGLSLGLVAEFEFAFGLLLIPMYFLMLVPAIYFNKVINRLKYMLYFVTGLLLAFSPRILFELKNDFRQTRVFFEYISQPHYYTPKPYNAVVGDRIELFKGYFHGLFLSESVYLIAITMIAVLFLYRLYTRKLNIQQAFKYLLFLLLLLFGISTFYKDTFWNYYYDGIEFLLLFTVGYLISFFPKQYELPANIIKATVLTTLLLLGIIKVGHEFSQPAAYDGIRIQREIVTYIQSQVKDQNNYCVHIYTPPVIPYTYDYLFLYNKINGKFAAPSQNWIDSTCWYIIEYDDNNERKDEWIASNIPKDGKKIQSKIIKDVSVELWKR